MKRIAEIAWSILCLVFSIAGAYCLTAFYLTMPTNMPYWVDMAIRFGFRVLLNDNMPDPDDMGVIAVLIYFAISMVISGIVFGIVGSLIWRRFLSQRLR